MATFDAATEPGDLASSLGTDDSRTSTESPAHPRYELLEEIGRGGMGVVRRARDRELDRDVAIKLLLDTGAAARIRFDLEAHVTARLQHPAIVPIYDVGRLEDGTPFYAMRLVGGESLARRIAACTTSAERLALLPVVLTVADAVAHAHASGVIHRDLKPDNVLVGEFGEVVVLDWGVARRSDDAFDPEHEATGEMQIVGSLTSAGAIIGTPAYMPPEQAAGEVVDARADVYALGAMLYHVLAGEAPFRGAPSEIVVRLTLEKPPPLGADVPLDLRAIVEQAMARDLETRYPSARELASDLRRYTAGQLVAAYRYTRLERLARFARRHRAIVGLAAVFVVVASVGAALGVRRIVAERNDAEQARVLAERERGNAETERIAADQARDVAQRGRDAAEALVSFMLDDLQGRLDRVGQLVLLQSVGERVEHYYAALAPTDDRPEDATRRVDALVLLGRAQLSGGRTRLSVATLQAAVDSARALGVQRSLALALRWQGTAIRQAGRLEESTVAFAESRDLADAVGDRELRARARIELARTLVQMSDVAGARAAITPGLELAETLVARAPGDGNAQLLRVDAVTTHAIVLVFEGDLRGGLDVLVRLEPELAQRLADDPADVRLQAAMGLLLRNLAQFVSQDGQVKKAQAIADRALAVYDRLVAADPENAEWRRVLVDMLDAHASLAGQAGEIATAAAGFERMAVAARAMLDDDPEDTSTALILARAEGRLGATLPTLHRVEESDAAFERAEAVLEPLANAAPDSDAAVMLVRVRMWQADALMETGRDEQAAKVAVSALALAEGLAARHPEHVEYKLRLARARTVAATAAGPTEARREYARAALTLLRELSADGHIRFPSDRNMVGIVEGYLAK